METYQNLSLEDLPNEIWRDVVGYEGLYQVSNLGRVKSLDRYAEYPNYIKRINGRIMSQQDNSKGYLTVILSLNGLTKKLYVHRLLAEAFIPNTDNKIEVNHIDLNKKTILFQIWNGVLKRKICAMHMKMELLNILKYINILLMENMNRNLIRY